jgi:hypothetical protein
MRDSHRSATGAAERPAAPPIVAIKKRVIGFVFTLRKEIINFALAILVYYG